MLLKVEKNSLTLPKIFLMNDPFGLAIHDFHKKGKAADIQVNSNYTENESIPVAYFFRDEKDMPDLEKMALKKCRGKILDVGAAAGCHSLYLQKKGYNITALEKSELSVEIMKKRGIVKVVLADIFEYDTKQYDTILLLMNGAGIGGTLSRLKNLLLHLKNLLHEGGQILIDSSDIKYLFEEEDGSVWIDLANDKYYGEMEYDISYKKTNAKFEWLFIDYEKLREISEALGMQCNLLLNGKNQDYLAQLKV